MCFTKKHFVSMGGFSNLDTGEGSKLIDFNNSLISCGPVFLKKGLDINKFNIKTISFSYSFNKKVS